MVHPYVGIISDEIAFVKDDFEVKEIIEVSIDSLLKSQFIQKPLAELSSFTYKTKNILCFEFDGKYIWGATAMMLNELRYILLE